MEGLEPARISSSRESNRKSRVTTVAIFERRRTRKEVKRVWKALMDDYSHRIRTSSPFERIVFIVQWTHVHPSTTSRSVEASRITYPASSSEWSCPSAEDAYIDLGHSCLV